MSLLSLLLSLNMLAAAPAQQGRPPKAIKKLDYSYDSTKVNFTPPNGISHKTNQQALRTYGKIGAGQPLNHEDTLFLRKWSPEYLQYGSTIQVPKINVTGAKKLR